MMGEESKPEQGECFQRPAPVTMDNLEAMHFQWQIEQEAEAARIADMTDEERAEHEAFQEFWARWK